MTALHIANSGGHQECIDVFKHHIIARSKAKLVEEGVARRRAEADAALRMALDLGELSEIQSAITAHADAAEAGGARSAALAAAALRVSELEEERQKKSDEQRARQKAEKKRRQKEKKRVQGQEAHRDEGCLQEKPPEAVMSVSMAAAPVGVCGGKAAASASDNDKAATDAPSLEAAAAASNDGNACQDQDVECIVCLDEKRTHVFFPCGHLIVCGGCARMIAPDGRGACPMCKSPGGVCKVYGS